MTKVQVNLAVVIGLWCSSVWSADINVITTKLLPKLQGEQEISMLTVKYAPGEISPPHRHNAYTFLYMLEGSIITQVQGGKEVLLKAGDDFYENPNDIHIVAKNASDTDSAKFLVIYLQPPGTETQIVDYLHH